MVNFSFLKDIDECNTGDVNCGKTGKCENIPGSFTCVCNPGFTGPKCSQGKHQFWFDSKTTPTSFQNTVIGFQKDVVRFDVCKFFVLANYPQPVSVI